MGSVNQKTFRELIIGFGALVCALVAQAMMVWAIIDHLERIDTADYDARQEIFQYDVMLQALTDQERGLQIYRLDHSPHALATFERGQASFNAGIDQIHLMAANDPRPMRLRAEDAIHQVGVWNRLVATPQIAAIRNGHGAGLDPDAGETHLDAARADFAYLRENELDLLDRRDGLWTAAYRDGRLTMLLGTGLALLFTTLIGWRSIARLGSQQRAERDAAARVAEALERAQAAERAKTTFLSNMSHEMRTPLNGILGMAQAMEFGQLSSTQMGMLGVIRTSAKTLNGLIGDLLALARGEISPQDAAIGSFELGGLVRAAAAEFRTAAEIKGVALRTIVGEAADRTVRGDGGRLRQVLNCLLSNAVKYTEHGRVELTLEALGGDRYRLRVADTGIGFDEARTAEFFQGFAQADGSATRPYGGAGVGLALASRLARELGSKLEARSVIGCGSHFSLELELPAALASDPVLDQAA